MPRKPSPHPNELELEILRVLWNQGPQSAREIHDALAPQRNTRVSSTTKMLQVMVDKGLLKRDESRRPIRFEPSKPAETTQGEIVNDLIRRVFGGAAEKMVLSAVNSGRLSADQLAEIRKTIAKMEKEPP